MAPAGKNDLYEDAKRFFVPIWESTRDISGIALSFVLGMMFYRDGDTYPAIFFILMAYLSTIGYGFYLKELVKKSKKKKEGRK